MNTIVIDTNIFISALIKDSLTRKILTNLKINFLFPEFEFKEISKYKKLILERTGLSKRDFYTLFLRLLKYVQVIPKEVILRYKREANQIMSHIHKEDTVFIATALAFKCPIWSDDKDFQKQKIIEVFKTKDMIGLI